MKPSRFYDSYIFLPSQKLSNRDKGEHFLHYISSLSFEKNAALHMARHEMKIGYGIDGFACIDKFLPHFC